MDTAHQKPSKHLAGSSVNQSGQALLIRQRSGGQALLIVLLAMAVILTVVLSILSRTVTDINITTRSEESVRAFSAAEAGVEQALIAGADIQGQDFTADISGIAESTQNFIYPAEVARGDAGTVWLESPDGTGNLNCGSGGNCQIKVCFGDPSKGYTLGSSTNPAPAIELSVAYEATPGSPDTTRVARAALDPDTTRIQASGNGFDTATSNVPCTVGNKTFQFSCTIDFSELGIPSTSYNVAGGLQFANVRFLYNNTNEFFGVTSGINLPSQGQNIVSTGSSGGTNRKVEVKKLFGEMPPIFQSAVYAPLGITK